MIIKLNKIIGGEYVRKWCRLPYPNYPKGCPMYGTRDSCPPKASMWHELIEAPYFLVYQEFDLAAQAERMRDRHPEWSEKMCRNSRYWQKGLMKRLMREAEDFLILFPEGRILGRPEANGIFVMAMALQNGIEIKRIPKDKVIKIVVIGKALKTMGA